MSVRECQRAVTLREYNLWQLWFQEQYNQPSRTDHYLMAIAAEMRMSNVKKPKGVKLEHFRLKFVDKNQPVSREQAAAASKAKWLGMVGKKPVIIPRGDSGH